MSDKGGTTSTNTISKSDPWSGLVPYLTGTPATPALAATPGKYITTASNTGTGGFYQKFIPGTPAKAATPGTPGLLPEAANLYSNGPSLVPPQSQATLDAYSQAEARARAGSPINSANDQLIADTLSGKYLDPNSNPYLLGTFNQGADAVQGRINSLYAGSNRAGSGLQQDTYQKNLNDLANTIYGGNYQAERARQLQASSLAPGVANQDYFDASKLLDVGNARDAYALQQAQEPYQRLANYAGLLSQVNGGGQTNSQSQQPYYTNPLAQGLGLGLGGLALYNGLAGLGTTTAAGAGLGTVGAAAGLAISDRRAKTDIKRIGATDDGLPVYTYRYKGSKQFHMGVMAQDVEKVKPWAVGEINGVKAVDYSAI